VTDAVFTTAAAAVLTIGIKKTNRFLNPLTVQLQLIVCRQLALVKLPGLRQRRRDAAVAAARGRVFVLLFGLGCSVLRSNTQFVSKFT
jgi:hypothetical protein